MFRRSKAAERKTGIAASKALSPGTLAPDFFLPSTTGEELSLSDFRGRPLVLVFYPADFSSVCGDQLALYNEVLPLFEAHKAQVLAISVDGIWSHHAFSEQRHLGFPLLSDFEPKGAVAQSFGVFDASQGLNRRALFVIDALGVIRWSHVSPTEVNPGADGILKALEALKV
jgi:peroxiredoxin (alkyl hydroperoxide reductase subunit C)